MRKTKKCRHGTFTYYTQDYYIGGALEATGENSPAELDRLKLLVPPDGHAIMAGANIGTLAVPMARYLAIGSLIALEPEPTTYDLIFENFRQNGLDGYDIWQRAVGNRIGKAWITRIDYNAPSYNSGSAAIVEDPTLADAIEVEMVTIDSLGLTRLDLLHVDVEGSERTVIDGAFETIRKFRPFLYVENNVSDKSAALIRLVTALGYRCHWHFPALYNPDPAGGLLVSCNMLCIPDNRTVDPAVLADTLPLLSENENCDQAYGRLPGRIASKDMLR